MLVANSLVADASDFRDMTTGAQVIDVLEDRFRKAGAVNFIATGIPLPGRPLAPLVLRANWGEYRGDKLQSAGVLQSDLVLHTALRRRRPFEMRTHCENKQRESPLISILAPSGEGLLVGIPVFSFLPDQGCVLAAGGELLMDARTLLALDYLCTEAFGRLFELGALQRERPGDLSARERRVVELSALGKTANDIASLLEISQRTVHAHLQNASEKLRASNKTHTVVEALRYGQIEV
jgi:LuxR family transcriptional regulator, quorum-sensing system regulator BjaR1